MIHASRRVAHPPERVFALLADLRRHWPLLGDSLAEAELNDGTGLGGAVLTLRVRPWPARRVVTRVLVCEPPSLLAGDAYAGGSRARIEWRIAGDRQGEDSAEAGQVAAAGQAVASGQTAAAAVSLSAVIDPAGPLDRLLAVLLRPWLRHNCRAVLHRLERELDEETATS